MFDWSYNYDDSFKELKSKLVATLMLIISLVCKDLVCIMMPFIRIYVVFLCNMEKLIYTYRHLKF